MAKSFFPESILSQGTSGGSLTLESIAGKLAYFHEQLQLIHWQTSGYAEHMATGGAYEYVHGFKDGLMEKLMGYTGKKPGAYRIEPIITTSSANVAAEMLMFGKELKGYAEANGFLDIGNLADEFSGEAAKFKYLLTLS